jgi:hypothetical protein
VNGRSAVGVQNRDVRGAVVVDANQACYPKGRDMLVKVARRPSKSPERLERVRDNYGQGTALVSKDALECLRQVIQLDNRCLVESGKCVFENRVLFSTDDRAGNVLRRRR